MLGLNRRWCPVEPFRRKPETARPWRRWLNVSTRTIEARLVAWIAEQRQITVCGHTHRAACAGPWTAPYFNAGSCTYPGAITGVEIWQGIIRLIRWTAAPANAGNGLEKELLADPCVLAAMAH